MVYLSDQSGGLGRLHQESSHHGHESAADDRGKNLPQILSSRNEFTANADNKLKGPFGDTGAMRNSLKTQNVSRFILCNDSQHSDGKTNN